MSQEYTENMTHVQCVIMTLDFMSPNILSLEHTGFFITRTHARDHGMNSLFLFFFIYRMSRICSTIKSIAFRGTGYFEEP